MGFPYLVSHIPVLALLVLYVFLIRSNIEYWKSHERLFILLSTVLFFIIKINDFLPRITSLDESQWIVCARSMEFNFHHWIKYFYINDFTRILTIFPLFLMGKLTGNISYFETSLLFNGFLVGYLLSQYYWIKEIFEDKVTAIYTYVVFFVALALCNHMDFIVYNSEAPSIFLIGITIYIFTRLYKRKTQSKNLFLLAGLTVSMIPFAKEQAILLALFLFIVLLIYLIRNGKYKFLIFYISGCVISSLIFLFPLFYYNTLDSVLSVLSLGVNYSVSGFSVHDKVAEQFDWYYAINSGFSQVVNPVTSFALFCFVVVFYWRIFKVNLFNKIQGSIFFPFLLFYLLIALFSILSPKNFKLLHYSILLFPVCVYSIAFVFQGFKEKKWVVFLLFVFAFFGDFYYNNHRSIFNVKGYKTVSEQLMKLDYYRCVKESVSSDDKLLIWGFGHCIYADLDVQRAGGFLYPQFAFGDSNGAKLVRDRYMEELQREKPAVILEIVGPNALLLNDTLQFSIKNAHPMMYESIVKNYTKEVCENGIVLWKKNGTNE
jgi:hypothetical protein